MARQVLDNGVILPSEYSDDWYDDMTSNLTKLDEVIGSDAEKLSASDVGDAAISNDYDDLDDKPAYNILRRASVTLTAGGTGNYSDLDSTSKIKAGDYVLDAVNKLYSITAIDTANSTYTVSAAAIINITDKSELGAAALSNSYDDLNNLPSYGITRLVNTAITDNSNVAFANISSVSKIAAGDFLLDTAGKMYLIASVDTANETAAVTTPVTQLALDANVMHLSRNETAAGNKTFTDNINAKKIISNVAQLQINARSDADSVAVIAGASASDGGGVWVYGKNTSNKSMVTLQVYDANTSSYHAARFNMDGSLTPTVSNNGLGSQSFKWVGFNGINPGALSFPDLSGGLDISSAINTGNSDNSYTPLVDGYISVKINNTSSCAIYANQSDLYTSSFGNIVDVDLGGFSASFFMPVTKNVACRIVCRNAGTIVSAKFFPNLGNV